MITVGMDVDRIPFCCGVLEAGNFNRFTMDSEDDLDDYMGYLESGVRHTASHDDVVEAYKECLRNMLRGHNERDDWTHKKIIQFWFVKALKYTATNRIVYQDNFCNEELRQIVMALPGVQKIGEAYVNPNSNNIIEGYYIFNNGEITVE